MLTHPHHHQSSFQFHIPCFGPWARRRSTLSIDRTARALIDRTVPVTGEERTRTHRLSPTARSTLQVLRGTPPPPPPPEKSIKRATSFHPRHSFGIPLAFLWHRPHPRRPSPGSTSSHPLGRRTDDFDASSIRSRGWAARRPRSAPRTCTPTPRKSAEGTALWRRR